MADKLLLEDGSTFLELEDASGDLLLETGGGGGGPSGSSPVVMFTSMGLAPFIVLGIGLAALFL